MPNHDDRFWKGVLFWLTVCVLPVAVIACINVTFSLATIFGRILALIVVLAFLAVFLNLLRSK